MAVKEYCLGQHSYWNLHFKTDINQSTSVKGRMRCQSQAFRNEETSIKNTHFNTTPGKYSTEKRKGILQLKTGLDTQD